MSGRRGAAVALSALVLVGSSWTAAPATGAHEGRRGTITCVGRSDSTYDPPLTLQPRVARVHTDARYLCNLATGVNLPATGSLDAVSPGASCLTVASTRATETVKYADGRKSSIVYDRVTTSRVAGALLVELSGRVAGGRGAGQAARRVVSALPEQPPTECLTSGLRGSTGRAQLEIRS
ncbi:hypothetical protein [Streptomyces sp. C36]|uniref:hypothetical protein n=1 Tax=Streptomyces sp. C36 TaxID=3237122 RepID=UPI0034C65DA7